MSRIITGILAILSYFGVAISFIWAIVEFILYLVKDREFNWWSVYTIVICGISVIVFGILTAILKAKKTLKPPPPTRRPAMKSHFQKRLEEMAEKQKK